MPRKRFCLVIVFMCMAGASSGQPRPYTIELFGAFTTSSKLFPYPADPSEHTRSFFLPLTNIFHAGAEVRASISSFDLQLGLGTEFIQKTEIINVPVSSSTIPVRDGYRVIPIEITGYFRLPIGNDPLHLYLGGGVGIYSGERIYQYNFVSANVIGRTGGFGIHILCGGEYALLDRWSLRTEIKIRDIQFESVNQFSQPSVVYAGNVFLLPQEPFRSKFNVDGMTVRTGIAYHF